MTKPTTDVTSAGSHYLKTWAGCPRKGAYQHVFEHPKYDPADTTIGMGLEVKRKPQNLFIGSCLHDGLEAWYLSRIRDGEDTGEASLDLALDAFTTNWNRQIDDVEDHEKLFPFYDKCRSIFQQYHNYYGQGGALAEYPNLQIAINKETGKPWVEQHFDIDLGEGFKYTCRTDLIVWYNNYLYALDHKSSKASWVGNLMMGAEMEAQFTGEILCLKEDLPEDTPIGGVIVNVLVKDRGVKSHLPPFDRGITTRTPEELSEYRSECLDLNKRIISWIEKYRTALAEGVDPLTALRYTFPKDGTRTGECTAYYRKCEYWALCKSPELSSNLINNLFRPKTVRVEDKEDDL
jgi:hypothetical protein